MNLNEGLKYSFMAGGLSTIGNSVVQFLGGNLKTQEFLFQLIKSGFLGIVSVGVITLLKNNFNLPVIENISEVEAFFAGLTFSGLTTKENGQNYITGSFSFIGMLGGLFFGHELDVLIQRFKEGLIFFRESFNIAKEVKFPNLYDNLKLFP
ncbi:MAG: hypothetical protein NZM02_01605 [Patescibacteria group bacterium]|nr:hypothetical protein [Patescibacteria group bacterium]